MKIEEIARQAAEACEATRGQHFEGGQSQRIAKYQQIVEAAIRKALREPRIRIVLEGRGCEDLIQDEGW